MIAQLSCRKCSKSAPISPLLAGVAEADLTVTVRAVYRWLGAVSLSEPRVLSALLAETLARPPDRVGAC